ncbi:glycosyltransferase family 4 protein [Neobacillus drentensis]|uniref:glycosyltransferase family 4 protein n=1 Tax=Neobacillus drentensis TaxID=220684 RepID=UPI002FFDE2B1
MMKNILVINHFPTVIPPTSGGTLRYYHLYKELSRYYNITLLSQTLGHKTGFFLYSPTFREYKVEKELLSNEQRDDFQISNENSYEFTLIEYMKLSYQNTVYKKYFNDLYNTSDIIIHESPFLLGYDQYLGIDSKMRIYNSHNHEYVLAKQIWTNEKAKNFLPILYAEEKKLVEGADLVFTTSENERESFIDIYHKNPNQIKLAPNGILPYTWIKKISKTTNKGTQAMFIGSEYQPNIEAVEFIIHRLADKCPDLDFIIAGGCCNPFIKLRKTNVKLLGRVHHKQKLRIFAEADMAINPIMSGAGVNLKTLEFLSAGIPLFSTEYGVRGLHLIDHHHYIHAERENFAVKLNDYYQKETLLKEVSSNSQKYINDNYTWSKIAKGIHEEIEGFKTSNL